VGTKSIKKPKRTISIIAILCLLFLLIIIFVGRPLFLYRHPIKVLGYCAYDVDYYNGYSYTTTNDGLRITSIDSSSRFNKILKMKTGGMANGIRIADGKIYLAGETALLTIYDIADPLNPIEIGKLNSGIGSVKIQIHEQIAVVTTYGNGTYIIDISDSSLPKILSRIATGRSARAVDIIKDYLFIGDPDKGLFVYDIKDLRKPKKVLRVTGTIGVFDIFIDNTTMVLGCHHYGIQILDISVPENPVLISKFGNGGEAYGVAYVDDYILVGDLQDGFEIWENSISPKLIYQESSNKKHVPHAITLAGDKVFLADQDRGFESIDWKELIN